MPQPVHVALVECPALHISPRRLTLVRLRRELLLSVTGSCLEALHSRTGSWRLAAALWRCLAPVFGALRSSSPLDSSFAFGWACALPGNRIRRMLHAEHSVSIIYMAESWLTGHVNHVMAGSMVSRAPCHHIP